MVHKVRHLGDLVLSLTEPVIEELLRFIRDGLECQGLFALEGEPIRSLFRGPGVEMCEKMYFDQEGTWTPAVGLVASKALSHPDEIIEELEHILDLYRLAKLNFII